MSLPLPLLGIDFTCAPTRRKPITVARGRRLGAVLRLDGLEALPSLPDFEALLARPGPWLGVFDFPFGLPRAFVDALALGTTTDAVLAGVQQRCVDRMAFRAMVDAFGNSRPAGQRLLHRATDGAMRGIRSTSPLQTRYVPVGFMYYEGLSRLLAADVAIPRLRVGSAERTALEGYPGLVAHEVLQRGAAKGAGQGAGQGASPGAGRVSYKNSDAPDRLIARKTLLGTLETHGWRGMRLKLSPALHDHLVADASGDRIDAVLCLVQAAWSQTQPDHAIPMQVDAVEGWIVGAVPVP